MAELAYKMSNDIKWKTSDRELYVPGTAYQVSINDDDQTPCFLIRHCICKAHFDVYGGSVEVLKAKPTQL